MTTPHKIEATVFVYRHKETGKVKCEYLENAKELEDAPEWEHMATLEPRMWIEYHWKDDLPAVCAWNEIDNLNLPDTWEAECGAVWTFNEGGPKDNEVNFCPKCGKSVTETVAP